MIFLETKPVAVDAHTDHELTANHTRHANQILLAADT